MNQYIQAGENYLKKCVFDGLAHSYDVDEKEYVKAYPEVTGYVLKYFADTAHMLERNMIDAALYLVKIQNSNGGFYSFDRKDILYSFDTAQIARGLLAVFNYTNDVIFLNSALKAGEFLLSSQQANGAIIPYYNINLEAWVIRDETYEIWNGPFSGLMCKLTEAFRDFYAITGEKKYKEAMEKTANFYESADYIEYTHPLGYWIEGLIAAKRMEKVREVVDSNILRRIENNGYISYKENLSYGYVSGTIQLGIILAKIGYFEEAKLIRNYGRLVQSKHESGGLFQYADSTGNINRNIHSEINSWGTKYFCELERLLEER